MAEKKSKRRAGMDGIDTFHKFMATYEPEVDLGSSQGKAMARVWYGAVWSSTDYVCLNADKLDFSLESANRMEGDLTKGMNAWELLEC